MVDVRGRDRGYTDEEIQQRQTETKKEQNRDEREAGERIETIRNDDKEWEERKTDGVDRDEKSRLYARDETNRANGNTERGRKRKGTTQIQEIENKGI